MTTDISNIINVNIAKQPTTLTVDNMSVIALFTDEIPLYAIDGFKIYKNASDVAGDFGSNSQCYKMAKAIYNQSLNIQAGDGHMVIIPKKGNVIIAATSTTISCPAVIVNLFKTVKDGAFKINLDGTEAEVTGLDFSGVSSAEDIANVIRSKFTTEAIAVNLVVDENNISFVAANSGNITMEISSPATGTDLTAVDYLNIAKSTKKQGTDVYTGPERVKDAYLRTKDMTFYEAIINTDSISKDDILDLAEAIQNDNKIALFVMSDLTNVIETGNEIKNKRFNKTRILYYSNQNDRAVFLGGYTSKALSINYNSNNTAYNLAVKEVIGLAADETIDNSVLASLKAAGVDCYPSVKGLACIQTSGENDFIDNVLFKNWLKSALEIAGFNCLRLTNTVPQTETGVGVLKSAYEEVLKQGKTNGFIHEGTWNLPIYLGTNRELFNKTIEQIGYYIYSIPVSQQQRSDREKRKAPAISIALKCSGAINSSDVLVYVNY